MIIKSNEAKEYVLEYLKHTCKNIEEVYNKVSSEIMTSSKDGKSYIVLDTNRYFIAPKIYEKQNIDGRNLLKYNLESQGYIVTVQVNNNFKIWWGPSDT